MKNSKISKDIRILLIGIMIFFSVIEGTKVYAAEHDDVMPLSEPFSSEMPEETLAKEESLLSVSQDKLTFTTKDIRTSDTINFRSDSGKVQVLIFGGIGTCGNTNSGLASFSKLTESIDLNKVNLYAIDIKENDNSTILSATKNISDAIQIAEMNQEVQQVYYTYYAKYIGSGSSYIMPLIIYMDAEGEVYAYTTGFSSSDNIKENLEKGGIFEEIKLAAVTGLKAEPYGKNKVRLTWEPSAGAEGYLVYGQKNGAYGYVGMTTTGTVFTDVKALDTDYNYYWVFPYVTNSDSKMIPGGTPQYVYAKGIIPAVLNLKPSSVVGGVKLTWTKYADAEGYLIYGIRGDNGTYGYIGMTTKGTTFTDTKAYKTQYNFYWVFPYHKNSAGKMIVGGTPKYVYGRAK